MSDYVGDNIWIPKDGDDTAASKLVWSTKKVNDLIVAMDQGYKPKIAMPFYEGRQFLRKGNIVFEYTQEEIAELAKCASDIVYFAEKYAVVMTDEGIRRVQLRDYQKDMLRNFQNDRFNIVLASRQMGKTVTASIFNAWYLTFQVDKNTLLLANKSDTTKEIIDKAKTVIENLPFFMKPGILKYDVMNVKCDNGCRLVGQSTTAKAGIGFTIHTLFLDEFAHIHPSIVDAFYENVYPTLSASKVSRIIITSTPNGFNKFYEIYSAAERGENAYRSMRIDWWQHPDRDDDWYKRELGNLGSEEAFNRQYGNEFVSSSNLLFDPATMKKLRKGMVKYKYEDIEDFENINMDLKDYIWFRPDIDVDDLRDEGRYFTFSVDIAEGNGGDFSVINMFEIVPMNKKHMKLLPNPGAMYDFFRLEQIGIFRSNEHVIEDFAKVLYTLAVEIFNPENTKLIIEYNTYGSILIKYLQTLFPQRNDFDEEMIVRFKHRHDAKTLKPGVRVKSDNKAVMCQNLKKLVESNRINFSEWSTVVEASMFGTLPNGSYGAQHGNDDVVMSCVTMSEFLQTVDYADFIEELLDFIDEDLYGHMEKILYKDQASDGDMQYDIYDLLN